MNPDKSFCLNVYKSNMLYRALQNHQYHSETSAVQPGDVIRLNYVNEVISLFPMRPKRKTYMCLQIKLTERAVTVTWNLKEHLSWYCCALILKISFALIFLGDILFEFHVQKYANETDWISICLFLFLCLPT